MKCRVCNVCFPAVVGVAGLDRQGQLGPLRRKELPMVVVRKCGLDERSPMAAPSPVVGIVAVVCAPVVDIPVEMPVETLVETPVDMPAETLVEAPVDIPVDRPGEIPVEKPVDTPVDTPVGRWSRR
jgi:hypothetical protein